MYVTGNSAQYNYYSDLTRNFSMLFIPSTSTRDKRYSSSYASMNLCLSLALVVAGGNRPVNQSEPLITTLMPTTELDIAERLMEIVVNKNDDKNHSTNVQDNLRVLSNIVQIEFENEAPVHISNPANSSRSLMVIRDSPEFNKRRSIYISPIWFPLNLISIILSFMSLVATIILYLRYPVIHKQSRIYVAPTNTYNESSSLTSSCE